MINPRITDNKERQYYNKKYYVDGTIPKLEKKYNQKLNLCGNGKHFKET